MRALYVEGFAFVDKVLAMLWKIEPNPLIVDERNNVISRIVQSVHSSHRHTSITPLIVVGRTAWNGKSAIRIIDCVLNAW
jgi:hypothetical protein